MTYTYNDYVSRRFVNLRRKGDTNNQYVTWDGVDLCARDWGLPEQAAICYVIRREGERTKLAYQLGLRPERRSLGPRLVQ